ncbi:MAG: D-alanyl-D-alanine carboxypeptidase/D-alanyl-D-alanine-endopeptidase [Paraprevotella sp.]|nr:D-alanyl-D-alanine carboxypeptidase/D-alanyl-D-alanine-endopeptidase [Paraprevotella sp.]
MRKTWYQHILMVLWLLGGLPLNVEAQTDTVKVERSDAEWAQALTDSLTLLLNDELFTTSQLGLCVYDLTADTALFVHNARQRMRPASTEKILTAITALSELGSDYRFFTRLYVSGEVRGNTLHGDVYVKGGFDPTFGKSDLQQFTTALSSRGIKSVKGALCADVSMKDTLKWGMGWCWDDDNPTLTPLLYLGRDVFMDRMRTMARERGITFSTTKVADCPSDAVLLKACSTPLSKVLERMMKESDNLYAEAVFYALAAKAGKPYATRKDALYLIEKQISAMGFDPEKYSVADGSGLSLYNYLTPELETALLRYAYTHRHVYEPFYESLPIAGVDGTLKKRMKDTPAHYNVRAKTGTLTGVYSLAGYATAANGHHLAFCIINQGVESGRIAREFQDKVCVLLCR